MGRVLELIERDASLDVLDRAMGAADQRGRTVLIAGEAGVGKTALVDAVAGRAAVPVLRGACEPLFTARPLGPFVDIATALPASLAPLFAGGTRVNAMLPAILEELTQRPSVVIIEDAHWADKASLDLVALLGRRMPNTRSLLVVTFRDDELSIDHPLRQVLAALVGQNGVERIRLQPLSVGGVAQMLGTRAQEARSVYQRTGGNPFFISEVMAEHGEGLPASVADAVLGRVARLEPSARRLLEALSIVPAPVGPDIATALGGPLIEHLDALLNSGMVVRSGNAIVFRHELVREAVAATVDPVRAAELHRIAMHAFIAAGADPAVIAHHAEGAADTDALRRYAREAAEAAMRVGAHREAAAQFGRALRAGVPDTATEAELLEVAGNEALLSDRFDTSLAWLERAVALRRDLGDPRRSCSALLGLARVQGCYGRPADAVKSLADAIDTIADDRDSLEYAKARAGQIAIAWMEGRLEEALDLAREVEHLARQHDSATLIGKVLINLGTLEIIFDDERGWDHLLEAADLGHQHQDAEQAGNAYLNMMELAAWGRRADVIDTYSAETIEYCVDNGLDLWTRYLECSTARSLMDRGRWDDATAALPRNVEASTSPLPRIDACLVLGIIRARRGDSGARALLVEAAELSIGTTPELRIAVVAATLEAMWLGLQTEPLRAPDLQEVVNGAQLQRAHWNLGATAWWLQRVGLGGVSVARADVPWWAMVDDRVADAVDQWRACSSPYEEALALCASAHADDVESGLELLDRLDARAAREAVLRDLRAAGRPAPRGQRSSTKANPAGLTSREMEVAELLARGLRNADIAAQLVVATKTVDHHVSSILSKLNVSNRAAVADALRRRAAVG